MFSCNLHEVGRSRARSMRVIIRNYEINCSGIITIIQIKSKKIKNNKTNALTILGNNAKYGLGHYLSKGKKRNSQYRAAADMVHICH